MRITRMHCFLPIAVPSWLTGRLHPAARAWTHAATAMTAIRRLTPIGRAPPPVRRAPHGRHILARALSPSKREAPAGRRGGTAHRAGPMRTLGAREARVSMTRVGRDRWDGRSGRGPVRGRASGAELENARARIYDDI